MSEQRQSFKLGDNLLSWLRRVSEDTGIPQTVIVRRATQRELERMEAERKLLEKVAKEQAQS